MSFAPVKRLKLAEQLASSIRSAIIQGTYGPGDTLPSERDLAGQFEVNRSSVREAILRLEAWGLVEVKQGGGTRVRDFLTSAGLQVLPFLTASVHVDVLLHTSFPVHEQSSHCWLRIL